MTSIAWIPIDPVEPRITTSRGDALMMTIVAPPGPYTRIRGLADVQPRDVR
jgi:hypothetical protein